MATPSDRRTGLWLLAAVLLLVATALVATLSEGGPPAAAPAVIEFPRHLRAAEYQRMERRALLPPVPLAGPAADPGRKRDPLLSALPPHPSRPVVVFEANALRHSRLGELFLGCLGEADRQVIDDLRRMGIDPLKDVDRVAVTPEGLAVSGFFDRARWPQIFEGAEATPWGRDGTIYQGAARGGPAAAAVWRDQLFLVGSSREAVQAALDRVEGRAPASPPIAEEVTYGEVYGVLPGEALRALAPPGTGQGDLARRLAEVASRVELHADAMNDVAVTARVRGQDSPALEDLARALGAALAVARVDASARGDRELAELLDHARVSRGGEGFSLELALPAETLERWFAGCGERAASSPRAGRSAGKDGP